MIWAVLVALGVPLVRVRATGKKRWVSGHGLWVSDVFAWRGSPAAWKEDVVWVAGASARPADAEERTKLRRIGDDPLIASLALAEGGAIEVAARREHWASLLGPFAETARNPGAAGDARRRAGSLG